MGTVFPRQSDNMKLIAVLALAAVAFAEPEADPKADPWLTYGYGLGHAGVYGGYRAYGAYPYAGVYGGYRAYGAYPYSYGYYGKRSAEAEPEAEADPALLYTSSVAGGLVSPVVSSLYTHPVASVAAPLTTYAHAVAAPAVVYSGVAHPLTYTHHVAAPAVA